MSSLAAELNLEEEEYECPACPRKRGVAPNLLSEKDREKDGVCSDCRRKWKVKIERLMVIIFNLLLLKIKNKLTLITES